MKLTATFARDLLVITALLILSLALALDNSVPLQWACFGATAVLWLLYVFINIKRWYLARARERQEQVERDRELTYYLKRNRPHL